MQWPAVGVRSCTVSISPDQPRWRLTARGQVLVLGIVTALALAAMICIGLTLFEILSSPVYLTS